MVSKTTLEILEFHKILKIISDFAYSDATKKSILEIHPFDSKEDIERRFAQIRDIWKLTHDGSCLPFTYFSDIQHLLIKVKPEGAVLESYELAEFMPVLEIAFSLSSLLMERNDLISLKELTKQLTGFPDVIQTLKRSIDSEGNILDSASFMLSELRKQIRTLEGKIRKKLEEITRDEKISVFLQDHFITTRSGRWVVPVRMDSKGMVPGVVHDVSKSGETAFIEPLTIIQFANEFENLKADQKAEEIRILRNICSFIRNVVDAIDAEFKVIVYLDVLNSIARFADILKMETPQIYDSNTMHLVGARHPLLQLSFQKMATGQHVVPLNVTLDGNQTVMVITGANAGGKTIAIKTIGLLLLMAFSGMPIPAESSTRLPFMHTILVDIGDEQSIEQNLSTFSAHISNISEILRRVDSRSVVLIDEIGTGTDPEEGAALACAILSEIRERGALIFATTHLSDIKVFVHRTDGMVNASMEFDRKTLTPLYTLRIGEPGQSHALAIAKRYGLPDRLIAKAEGLLGTNKVEFDNLIADLNQKRVQYENALNDMRKQYAEIEKKNKSLEEMLSDAEIKNKEIIAKAYHEASEIILEAKRQMHDFVDEIKKKDKSERKKIIKKVENAHESVIKKMRGYDLQEKEEISIEDIQKGDIVYVRSLGHDALVVQVNRKNSRIKATARGIEFEVPITDIGTKRGKDLPHKHGFIQRDKPEIIVSPNINLIGLRVDEAISKLEQFLNHAVLAELREITIIHGIGKGLLLKSVHEHLDGHPLVKKFRSGTLEDGGKGVTIVTLV